jgi:hypothetical protein
MKTACDIIDEIVPLLIVGASVEHSISELSRVSGFSVDEIRQAAEFKFGNLEEFAYKVQLEGYSPNA